MENEDRGLYRPHINRSLRKGEARRQRPVQAPINRGLRKGEARSGLVGIIEDVG